MSATDDGDHPTLPKRSGGTGPQTDSRPDQGGAPGPMTSDTARIMPLGSAATLLADGSPRSDVASQPHYVDAAPAPLAGDRYRVRKLLGAGGMGEVHLCRDAYLGRDVAMKVMRSREINGTEGHTRFLREARLQGQLEHPSIVPVYDLASNVDGQPYFTMKRIQGTTLREALDALADGDAEAQSLYSRRRLITLLSQASQAVGFAHARHVVHRDLKPENIMLGEFGEIYVLDWGVARASGVVDVAREEGDEPAPTQQTQAGSLIGTPGYMSPEQARGDTDLVSPASDVYALGCILFELLTREPLHTANKTHALLLSTLQLPMGSPAERSPSEDIPEALDEICRCATSQDPADRYENAKEFSEALERFLDGERDAELRALGARQHLARADELLSNVAVGKGTRAEREEGMRELGRALALAPNDERALSLLSRLVFADEKELPDEALAELKQVEIKDRRRNNKFALIAYAVWLGFLIMFHVWGTKNTIYTLALELGVGSLLLYGTWMAVTGNVTARFMRVAIVANFVLIALTSSYLGPLLVVPGMAAVASAAFMVGLRSTKQTKRLLLGCSVASFTIPMLLSHFGVVFNPYSFRDGALIVVSSTASFTSGDATVFTLTMIGIVQQIAIYHLVGKATDGLVEAERRNFALAFRLRQLLPMADVK